MSVTAAQGFVAAGCHAGIKRRRPDMALIATDDGKPVTAAAVFTQNKCAAPPVELGRATLKANGGKAAAVIVNSGNANAGTGGSGSTAKAVRAVATTCTAASTSPGAALPISRAARFTASPLTEYVRRNSGPKSPENT